MKIDGQFDSFPSSRSPSPQDQFLLELLEQDGLYAALCLAYDRTGTCVAFRHVETGTTRTCGDDQNFSGNALAFPLAELQRLYVHEPVIRDGIVSGWLIYNQPKSNALSPLLRALPLALNFFLQRERLAQKARTLSLERFFKKLLSGQLHDPAEIQQRAEVLAVPVDRDWHVFLLEGIPNSSKGPFTSLLRRMSTYSCFFDFGKKSAGIFELSKQKTLTKTDMFEELLHPFVERQELAVGISAPHHGLNNLHRCLQEAEGAFCYAHLNPQAKITHWESLGAFAIVFQARMAPQSLALVERMIQPLIVSAGQEEAPLLHTLIVIEENHWNLSLAAKNLFIHYNTLKYRYGKIKKCLGLDLDDTHVRFDLSMALRLHLISELHSCISILPPTQNMDHDV